MAVKDKIVRISAKGVLYARRYASHADMLRHRASTLEARQQRCVSLLSPVESFRKGWQEVMNGETIPLSKLWEEFEKE